VNKWLHAAQIGKIVYDEDKGFFQNDIEYTHIAYYGHEFAPRIEDDLAHYPSSPLIKVSDDDTTELLLDMLNKENWGTNDETTANARIFAACELMTFASDEDNLYGFWDLIDEYPGFFDDKSILHDVATENGGEIRLDVKKLENCNMDTFVGFYFDYQIFDVPEELFNSDDELDVEKFFNDDTQRTEWEYPCRYCDKNEATGYIVVSNVEIDEDDEDDE